MNNLLNDIKHISDFYKSILMLIAMIAYVFLPPVFSDKSYVYAMSDWLPVAFGAFLSALILGCWIGKCVESESK
tara:strand:- start:393 stop:614 length:222 start_codon:yes stop_codon:yes gene_type:complete